MEKLTAQQRGQAAIEYILMVSIVALIFLLVAQFFSSTGFNEKLMKPLKDGFRRSYQFGFYKTRGLKGEDAEYHPRSQGGNNGRIFLRPGK